MSEQGSLVRRLPLAAGILGGVLLMGNRLAFTPDLVNSQSRADALGILLSAVLILTGLLWQQIQPSPPPAVELEGEPKLWLDPDLDISQQVDLGWASHTILTLTAIQSLVVWYQGQILLQRGILPAGDPVQSALHWQPGAIGRRAMQTGRAIYLVDLKLYPAKGEFTDVLMPANTASLLCQPMGSVGVMILGTNRPRTLTDSDQAWIEAIAQRLDPILQDQRGSTDSDLHS
ncbi:MAG: cofactor assembly of complex C subunit B [Synechococcaceae cyanobacterium SM2_3_2]|nr:cofactor assembly of complex C subunit B [Synechococcaceae cyanobacterium SM2_3_2]